MSRILLLPQHIDQIAIAFYGSINNSPTKHIGNPSTQISPKQKQLISDLNFSKGTQPRLMLHIGQLSNPSFDILRYIHFLQTG